MKIFSAAQVRAWDAFTIENEPITSTELMNRAARVFTEWFTGLYQDVSKPVVIFAGTGNNGGDGLAIARYLHQLFYEAKVLVCAFDDKRSADFESQLEQLPAHQGVLVQWLYDPDRCPDIPSRAIVIDALFGSGLNRPLSGKWTALVDLLNALPNEVVSVDIPSGMFADQSSAAYPVVQAERTFSFETPKRAFFYPENAHRAGEWNFGSISLHPGYYSEQSTCYQYLTHDEAKKLWKPRQKFGHKGTYGHSLLIGGSYGKMGAAVLSAKACLRAGVGLLSVCIPGCGYDIMQTSVPEAMTICDPLENKWTQMPDIQPYNAIGIGPGLGTASETASALEQLIQVATVPLVLDADALNLLARHPEWWPAIPPNSILTPHPGEFQRLFGSSSNDFEKNDQQMEFARKHQVFIVLKGAHTAIATPDGQCWFNSSGNPGMATGGSGDVLTGILTGLLAQGYSPLNTCLLGVYLHGLAGDIATSELGQESLIAGDLIEHLPAAWKRLQ